MAALGIVLIGCGGSGGSDRDNGSGGGGTGGVAVVLPEHGSIDVSFVPGSGRSLGDMWLNINRVYFDDRMSPQPIWTGDQTIQINAFGTPPIFNVGVEMPEGVTERRFTDFTLNVNSLIYEGSFGRRTTFLQEQILNLPYNFEGQADIRVLRGRRTGFQVFLDPTMFEIDDNEDPSSVRFLPQRFREVNIPNDTDRNKLQGFLADYVSFDISQMGNDQKPRFVDGSVANRVFFSGDGYGLGGSPNQANKYEALTLRTFQPIPGRFSLPSVDPSGRPFPGTYSLLENDPSEVDPDASKLISLVGIWYQHSQVVQNMGSTQMIAFPRSRDNRFQDVVLVRQSRNGDRYEISDLKWGYIEYNLGGTSRIFLFNIKDLPDGANIPPLVSGTVTVGGAGSVDTIRSGNYSLEDGTSGSFIVFRK